MERFIDCINPTTGEIFDKVAAPPTGAIDEAFQKAREVLGPWSKTPLEDRKAIIRRFADIVLADLNSLAVILTRETGKPIQQARNEIRNADKRIRFFLRIADRFLTEEVVYEDEKIEESIAYEPLGVVVNISAWNYPYNVGYNVFIPALLAGNVVLYKPSELALHTGLKFEEMWQRAGLPPHVFTTLPGDGITGAYLSAHVPADGYFFTGSYTTGMKILSAVRERTVPVQLELGGKDPAYVTDDVPDVRQAAVALADGAFYNCGQSCCSVERIYVHASIYEAFLQHFVEEVKSYKMGDPMDESTFIGPLTRAAQLEVLETHVADALAQGARLLAGGRRIARPGNWFEPTVLADCHHSMRVMREESFGPIIGIMPVKNDEEAIALMNDTSYGLTAAVYGGDRSRAERIFSRLNTGTVYFNACDRVSPYVPWSGRGHSGMGLTLSHLGLRAFTKTKSRQILKK